MNTLKVDFSKPIGKIKPMHAINDVPTVPTDYAGLYQTYVDAHIPCVRLESVGSDCRGNVYMDIEEIFPDFDADENDPASYDFAFSDAVIAELSKMGIKSLYRLGNTIENFQYIKAYHIYPPKDYEKWARICEHVIMHYNEGWANGMHSDIEYWEIWNEPDNEPEIKNNPMWKGTKEDYFRLYDVSAKYLKKRFPHLKFGGYASCGFYSLTDNGYVGVANSSVRTDYFIEFFLDFLAHIKESKAPFDFFSWHSYAPLKENVKYAQYAKEKLTEFGYGDIEIFFNEWNPGIADRGTLKDAANIAAMMCAMHPTPTDMAMYYEGSVGSTYCGLYNPLDHSLFKAYYSFYAFGQLYAMGQEAASFCDAEDVYQLAAMDENGKIAILIANTKNEEVSLKLETGFETKTWQGYKICEESDWGDFTFTGEEITLAAQNVVLLKMER